MKKSTIVFILSNLSMVSGSCDSLPDVPYATSNVTSSPPYDSGTVAHFECNIGYNPAGTSKDYVCSASSWTQGNLRCEEIYCRYVPPPDNGKIENGHTRQVGSTITFLCNVGYSLVGPSQMTCRADGEWSPSQPPTCQIGMCPEFGSVEHASVFQDTSDSVRNGYGSIVKVTCDWGYILVGSPNVKCQASGEWEEKPVCLVSKCPPYPGFNSSCVKSSELVLNNNYLIIKCMEGENVSVTRTGPDKVECVNQQWDFSEGVMNCYCDCKVEKKPEVEIHNLNREGFLKHGETLSWSCGFPWEKADVGSIKCLDGKSGTPSCVYSVGLVVGICIGALFGIFVLVAAGYGIYRCRKP